MQVLRSSSEWSKKDDVNSVAATWHPGQKFHADFAGQFLGHDYFLLIDLFLKWPEIFIMKSTIAQATIKIFKRTFATYGLLQTLVNNYGRQFASDKCKTYVK